MILYLIFYRVSKFSDFDFSQQYQPFIGFTPKWIKFLHNRILLCKAIFLKLLPFYVRLYVCNNKQSNFFFKNPDFSLPNGLFFKDIFPVFIWMVWVSPAVLKTTFLKSKQSVMTYRNYRSFDNDKLEPDWKNSLRVRNVSSYLVFEEIFLHVLQRHVSIKQKVTSANHPPYVTKATRKAIMKGTQLQHRYFENSSSETLMPINVS